MKFFTGSFPLIQDVIKMKVGLATVMAVLQLATALVSMTHFALMYKR